jgi:hypothetical protein
MNIEMPPKFKQAYQRVLLAAMKILFSKQANQQLLPSGDPRAQAKAVIDVVTTLYNESQGKMPAEIIVPVSVSLLMEAHKMLEKSGESKPEDLGAAMELMLPTLLKNFGMPEDQIEKMFADGEQTEAPAEPAGILGGAMGGVQ